MATSTLLLIRGLPGSGKSTLARSMMGYTHIESDMYFDKNGKYVFDGKKVPASHAWCLAQTKAALARGEHVVVSNTFVCLWEMESFKNLGYSYQVMTATGSFPNHHGATPDLIGRMRSKWESEAMMESAMITATIESDIAIAEITFNSSEVLAHQMPDAVHGWSDLCQQDQVAFSEDYALWFHARRYGNNEQLRVDIGIKNEACF